MNCSKELTRRSWGDEPGRMEFPRSRLIASLLFGAPIHSRILTEFHTLSSSYVTTGAVRIVLVVPWVHKQIITKILNERFLHSPRSYVRQRA